MIGIYRIRIGNRSYIGSSMNLHIRRNQHLSDLKHNRHCNRFLQNAYNKHKEFEFEILEGCKATTDDKLRELEKLYIEVYKPEFNIEDPITHFGQKKIYQFDKQGTLIAEYSCASEAANVLEISTSNIFHAAQENEVCTRTASGFYWQYTKDFKPRTQDRRETIIYVYHLSGWYWRAYKNMKECAKDLFPEREYTEVATRVNRVCRSKAASFGGYRFSYQKLECLDNTKLLDIKCFVPIIMVTPGGKPYVYERVSFCLRENPSFQQAAISAAITKNKPYRGYKFLRLGTESHELLESLKGIEATTQSETANVNA